MIEINGWPLIHIVFSGPTNDSEVSEWLDKMSSLLTKRLAFSVVLETSDNSQLSLVGQKAQSLWFKKSRESLGLYCRGLARVLLREEQREQLVGASMQKAMPFPMLATLDVKQARVWAQRQLERS